MATVQNEVLSGDSHAKAELVSDVSETLPVSIIWGLYDECLFIDKAFIHPSLDHVGKGGRVRWSVMSCPNTDCLGHNQSTEVMLLLTGSSLWHMQAEHWINFKDITARAQELPAACTAYLVREATESQLRSSNSHQDTRFLLGRSRYPATNIKHYDERLSDTNSDDQLKPMWSTLGQDITHHLTPLCPPLCMIQAGMDESFVYEYTVWSQHISPWEAVTVSETSDTSPHWHSWSFQKNSLHIFLPYQNLHTFPWNLVRKYKALFWAVMLCSCVGGYRQENTLPPVAGLKHASSEQACYYLQNNRPFNCLGNPIMYKLNNYMHIKMDGASMSIRSLSCHNIVTWTVRAVSSPCRVEPTRPARLWRHATGERGA
jgi:hypothetical protein